MTWFKARDAAQNNLVYDTTRGSSSGNANAIITNGNQAQQTTFFDFVTPNVNGFTVNFASGGGQLTNSGINYVSWTFRKQPKFFDIVTYTGNSTNRTIAHNLGSVPGTIIVKRTNTTGDWVVYHRSLGATKYVLLNGTGAAGTYNGYWNDTEPTDTVFSLSGTSNDVNGTGNTYVAYLFAHNAGGFGLTGTDNVISCGSYTGNDNNNGPVITLGYEPQWVMIKASSQSGNNWRMFDNMRGMDVNTTGSGDAMLNANTSSAEVYTTRLSPTATGFQITDTAGDVNTSGATYIYIAIRRGPMEVPTSGTSVYNAIARTGTGGAATVSGVGFAPDLITSQERNSEVGEAAFQDRLRGAGRFIRSSTSGQEQSFSDTVTAFQQNGVSLGEDATFGTVNFSGYRYINWFFKRAPGFFDVVCYTGNDTARTLTHNLAAVPELMIVKARSSTGNWSVYTAPNAATNVMYLNTTNASFGASGYWNNTAPTASVFTVGNTGDVNNSGTTFVAYLFATCAGVSKVGSYTGTGTTLQIDCGFTGGARFVMIKRTDSTGGWHVWDSARGIIAGNDPYLLLNSTAAEVTNTDYVDTYSAGFEISSTAPAAINASGGSFIFLAIA
jgi:hypothetical protein